MAIEVKIPAVGESITSGLLSAWLKKDGELVKDGEPILMLETDKISTEIPAPGSGAIRIQVEAGQEVKIGQVVATIDQCSIARIWGRRQNRIVPGRQALGRGRKNSSGEHSGYG